LVSLYTSQTATCPSLQEMVREEIASHGNVRWWATQLHNHGSQPRSRYLDCIWYKLYL
jgi:hypothetical protein